MQIACLQDVRTVLKRFQTNGTRGLSIQYDTNLAFAVLAHALADVASKADLIALTKPILHNTVCTHHAGIHVTLATVANVHLEGALFADHNAARVTVVDAFWTILPAAQGAFEQTPIATARRARIASGGGLVVAGRAWHENGGKCWWTKNFFFA